MNSDWNDLEVELIVADYFAMLIDELNDIPINKTQHRNALKPLLRNRTDGSIEFKHQNISAALVGLGMPYIRGYKPRFNFQRTLLTDKIQDYVQQHPLLGSLFLDFADKPPIIKSKVKFDKWLFSAPEIQKQQEKEPSVTRKAVKINYLKREEQNRALGLLGEELAIGYEKFLLVNAGKDSLADRVEWVSKEQGDGLGFDILSRNFNGTDKYIEVKTTKLGREAPFFFSSNEYEFSLLYKSSYHLYRIFDFSNQPKIYTHHGTFDELCCVEPVQYRGHF